MILQKQLALGKEHKKTVLQWGNDLLKYEQNRLKLIDSIKHKETLELEVLKEDIPLNVNLHEESFLDSKASNCVADHLDDSFFSDFSDMCSESEVEMCTDADVKLISKRVNHSEISNDDETIDSVLILDKKPMKYMEVGDNLDFKVKRRHMTIATQNLDYHLFNSIAVKNKVPTPMHLEGVKNKPLANASDIDLTQYFPNKDDERKLAHELSILVTKDLLKYKENIKWMKKYIPSKVAHEYEEFTKQKSEVVS